MEPKRLGEERELSNPRTYVSETEINNTVKKEREKIKNVKDNQKENKERQKNGSRK